MSGQVATESQREQHQLDGVSTIGSIKLNLNTTIAATTISSPQPLITTTAEATEKPQQESSQHGKPVDARVPPEEASENSETSHSSWNSSKRTDHHLQHQRLSVVLPPSQKSLLTPTIITTANEQPTVVVSTPNQLFSSLVQLNGQEVGLFTGLPSCTPNSADCLTTSNLSSINPFFWGVTAFNGDSGATGEQANGTLVANGNSVTIGQQQVDKSGSAAVRGASGSEAAQAAAIEANKAEHRQQLSKLSLDQFQAANAMMLSPLSFLLSPEHESWLRFGLHQANQNPLAAAAAAASAQTSSGPSNELPINQAATYCSRSVAEQEVMAYQQQQQQQQQQQDHFRLAAQDLSNQIAAAQQQQQASAQNGAGANVALNSTFNSSLPPTGGAGTSSYIAHRSQTALATQYGRTQQQQSIVGSTNNASYNNVLTATSNSKQQISSSAAPTASSSFPHQGSDGMQLNQQQAHLYRQQAQQGLDASTAAPSQPGTICTQSSPTSIKLVPKLPENESQKTDQSPLAAHRQPHQQTALLMVSNGTQVDPRLVEFHEQQQQNVNASRQSQSALTLHYENGQPIDIYTDQHLRQLCLAQHHQNQHNYHLQQQQQLQQQHQHPQHNYQELRTRQQQQQQPSYQNQSTNGQQQASQTISPYSNAITNVQPAAVVKQHNNAVDINYTQAHNFPTKESISNSNSLSSFNISRRQSLSGNISSSARSSSSRDTISVDVTVTANSRLSERGLESSPSSSSASLQEEATRQQQRQTIKTLQSATKPPIEQLRQEQASNSVKRAKKTGSNGKQETNELQEGEVVKRKSKGGRKKKLVTHEELIARKNRSKERNRVAAKRCRQKRKQFLDELRGRIENLNDSNRKLQKENTMLKNELELLKEHHKTCTV